MFRSGKLYIIGGIFSEISIISGWFSIVFRRKIINFENLIYLFFSDDAMMAIIHLSDVKYITKQKMINPT